MSADETFEEMSPGPREDHCKIPGCRNLAGWTVGRYANLCREHADERKDEAKAPSPALVETNGYVPGLAGELARLRDELRDLDEQASVVRELVEAIESYEANRVRL